MAEARQGLVLITGPTGCGKSSTLAALVDMINTQRHDHVVTIEDMQFKPAALTVKRGDTVTWKNKDLVPHTATAAGKFDSGNIAGNSSWSWKAVAPGEFAYVCTFHLGMKGSVTVK